MANNKQELRKPNSLLTRARLKHNWSLEDMANKLQFDKRTIDRWEKGETIPTSKDREKLRLLFQLSDAELGFGPKEDYIPFQFSIPYNRNSYFTGREKILMKIYEILEAKQSRDLPLAISGLGGMGKTQLALEYAYSYFDFYQSILWVRAASYSLLVSDFVTIAAILNLPEKDEQNQNIIIYAVKQWFVRNKNWLLIFDGVEDLDMLAEVLPVAREGHILLTTRSQLVGTRAVKLNIEKMTQEEGIAFLLRRAKKIGLHSQTDEASERDQQHALEIYKEMDGLPLALDQAGAYIESEGHREGVAEYLQLYQKRRADLLKIRGTTQNNHPMSVATTFSLAFDKVSEFNLTAASLLQLCAFLHPDNIPEELIEYAPDLQPSASDPLQFHEAIEELLKYSLVRRYNEGQAFEIHRLVQAVLQDRIDEQKKLLWASYAINAVDSAYEAIGTNKKSESEWYSHIKDTMKYDIHAQVCAELVEEWEQLGSLEALFMLQNAGYSFCERALYTQAEPLLQKAVSLSKQLHGSKHAVTANCITKLGDFYEIISQFEAAEDQYKQALAIHEQASEQEEELIAIGLNNLGQLYSRMKKYTEAEQCYMKAIEIYNKYSKTFPESILTFLHNVTLFYLEQNNLEVAAQLQQKLQQYKEKASNLEYKRDLSDIANEVLIYFKQNDYQAAEHSCLEALEILEQAQVPSGHRLRVLFLKYLAEVYVYKGEDVEAEKHYREVLEIHTKIFGPRHLKVAQILTRLAELCKYQKKFDEAIELYKHALPIFQQVYGNDHNNVIELLVDLAELYKHEKQYEQAAPLYEQALLSSRKIYGILHEITIYVLIAYTSLLQMMEKWEEAKDFDEFVRSLNPDFVEAVRNMQNQRFERKGKSLLQ